MSRILFSLALLFALSQWGCYTQLYTRAYWERSQGFTGKAPDSAVSQGDTLYPADSGASAPVVVNNYYGGVYRGSGYSEWDYPYFGLSFYSGGYRSYNDPYWWGGYRGYGSYHRPYRPYPRGGGSGGGNASGPYRSDKRLFPPNPTIPRPDRGHRREEAPAPQSEAPRSQAAPVEGKAAEPRKEEGSGERPPAPHKGKRR